MTTERLFVAAEIPSDIIDRIVSFRNKVFDSANVKWEPVSKLHLTLKFLGDTDKEIIPEIEEILKKLLEGKAKIPTAFTRFGAFYRNGEPKILWAGFEATEELIKLRNEIEDNFQVLGFTKETRKFKPHLTLARLKGYEDKNKILKLRKMEFNKKDFFIDKIILFKSELKPTGSVYSEIKSFELKN
jgi:2'-5' RNA ligase